MLPVAVGTIKRAILLDNLALLEHPAPLAVAVDLVVQVDPAAAVNLVIQVVVVKVEALVAPVVVHHVVLVLPAVQAHQAVKDLMAILVVLVNPVNLVNPEHPETLVLRDQVDNLDNPVDLVVIGVNLHLVVLLVVKVVALLRVTSIK